MTVQRDPSATISLSIRCSDRSLARSAAPERATGGSSITPAAKAINVNASAIASPRSLRCVRRLKRMKTRTIAMKSPIKHSRHLDPSLQDTQANSGQDLHPLDGHPQAWELIPDPPSIPCLSSRTPRGARLTPHRRRSTSLTLIRCCAGRGTSSVAGPRGRCARRHARQRHRTPQARPSGGARATRTRRADRRLPGLIHVTDSLPMGLRRTRTGRDMAGRCRLAFLASRPITRWGLGSTRLLLRLHHHLLLPLRGRPHRRTLVPLRDARRVRLQVRATRCLLL